MTPKELLVKRQSEYWQKREQAEKDAITDRTIADINKQLLKYYKIAMNNIIADFEATYDKLLATIGEGRQPTPADLYNLDRYWQLQAQLTQEMQKLGDKEAALLSKEFENQWRDIYEATAVPSDKAFATLPKDLAQTAIKTAWAPDGKNFSNRIWNNTETLVQTLNDKLINCIITGKKTSDLKKELMERFNVSLNQASTLVRTEAAHIQVEAAAQRYKDSGTTHYKFLGRKEHDIGCSCKELDGKIFSFDERVVGKNCPPMHPNCRCGIRAVVNIETEDNKEMFNRESKEFDGYVVTCPHCGKDFEMQYLSNFTTCPHCGERFYNPKESKTIYKDKYGNRRYYTDLELRAEEEELKQVARNKAAQKTTMGMTSEDAYTTKPLQKQIREAYEKEGSFTYYTHQCPHCGRYFNSTVRDKKKCPLCGSSLNISTNPKENIIEIKKCKVCGKLFKEYKPYGVGENYNSNSMGICQDCRTTILHSKDAEKLIKHGYTNTSIVAQLTGQEEPTNGFFKKSKRDTYDLRFEYIKEHPEDKEKLDAMYSWDLEKHLVVCIDCGKVFYVENKNNAAKRCPECQAKYRKKYKAQKEKERRAKKKKTK